MGKSNNRQRDNGTYPIFLGIRVWSRASSRNRYTLHKSHILLAQRERTRKNNKFGSATRNKGKCTVKIDSPKTEDDSQLQPTRQNKTYSSWWPRPPQNRSYWKDSRERKARSQLGWPIQSFPRHQTRYVRIGRHERKEITSPMEWRSLEEILHLIRVARGQSIIISFKSVKPCYHLHFHCYHLRCRLQIQYQYSKSFSILRLSNFKTSAFTHSVIFYFLIII